MCVCVVCCVCMMCVCVYDVCVCMMCVCGGVMYMCSWCLHVYMCVYVCVQKSSTRHPGGCGNANGSRTLSTLRWTLRCVVCCVCVCVVCCMCVCVVANAHMHIHVHTVGRMHTHTHTGLARHGSRGVVGERATLPHQGLVQEAVTNRQTSLVFGGREGSEEFGGG